MLEIYNSLTNRKEPFSPIEPGKVRMYVCGMTVYDYCHLGHARVLVVFDVVTRYLRDIGYDVTYVRNVTDIDDKIIHRANENHEQYSNLTARFIEAMHQDAAALGVLPPDQEPRATAHMTQIIDMIQQLVEKGYAYVADNGDVYYDVSRFEHYGELSGKHLEDLRAGARVEVGEAKDDPLDFALWKSAKPEEPSWDSPWGAGRPGWHIECSAMSTHCLGDHFDIHGGGQDLQFPHHENEIAQSEGATGHKFVNLWMHNGFVRINEEKMSKSLGNFFTIREILARYAPEVVRYFILTSHYRSPLNYSDESLDNARGGLERLYTALRDLPEAEITEAAFTPYRERFRQAMDDDFNTPEALAVLFELARELNRVRGGEPDTAAGLGAGLRQLGAVLGILEQDPESFLKGRGTVIKAGTAHPTLTVHPATVSLGLSDAEIDELIRQRNEARDGKDWAEADRIRDRLQELGIVLEDGAGGTSWRRG
jgi:cysteinyl-tRNA synthetase